MRKNNHWHRHLLQYIGLVVNIETEKESIKSVLILDIGIEEGIDRIIIFYQENRGLGYRGFLKGKDIHCRETGLKPAFKVPVPRAFKGNPETLD